MNPKLKECENLLPYFLLSLCPKINQNTSKSLFKIMTYGDIQTRIALIDQILYFVKELMLDTPDDFLICQYI